MDDEAGLPSPPSVAEVLDLGPDKTWSPRRRWLVSLVATGVSIGVLLIWSGWQMERANNPTFTAAEVLTLYRAPAPQAGDRLTWDAAEAAIRAVKPDSDDTVVTLPAECSRLLMDGTASPSGEVISVEVRTVDQRDREEDYRGPGASFVYADPESARQELQMVRQMLDRCVSFSTENVTFRVHDVEHDSDRQGASRLDFQLNLGSEAQAVRIELTQFGNSITWTLGAEVDTAGRPGSGSVNRQLVTRLRALNKGR